MPHLSTFRTPDELSDKRTEISRFYCNGQAVARSPSDGNEGDEKETLKEEEGVLMLN